MPLDSAACRNILCCGPWRFVAHQMKDSDVSGPSKGGTARHLDMHSAALQPPQLRIPRLRLITVKGSGVTTPRGGEHREFEGAREGVGERLPSNPLK
jgi:hypothetical protein